MSAHDYARSLADKGTPLSAISRATGLSMQDIGYLRPRERQSYSTPLPKAPAEATPYFGSERAQRTFFSSCKRLNVEPNEVLKSSRKRNIAWPRQEIMFDIFTTCPRMSYPAIARMMKRDHTTVVHGVRKHCERIGMKYEEAVAIRVLASGDYLSPELAASHINSAVFEAAMAKYGAAMGRPQ